MKNEGNTSLKIFDEIMPNELILKNLIESKIISVFIAIGSNKNSEYKIIWEILNCYCRYIDGNIRFYIYSEEKLNQEFLKNVIYYYGLESFVTFTNNDRKEDLLSFLLGCDMALISNDTTKEDLKMLCHFGLPILSLDKLNEEKNNNLCFYTTREPENIASYINVIGNNIEYKNKMIDKSLAFA